MNRTEKTIPHSKYEIVQDVRSSLESWVQSVGLDSTNNSCLFAITITPKKSFLDNHEIGLIQYSRREEFVTDLAKTMIHKVQSHLIRKPRKLRNQHLLIRSENVIESKSRFGEDTTHHSHSVWGIHPDLLEKFNSELLNGRILNSSSIQVQGRTVPLEAIIKDMKIKQIYDLTGWLKYQYKRHKDQSEFNRWFAFSTNKNYPSGAVWR